MFKKSFYLWHDDWGDGGGRGDWSDREDVGDGADGGDRK